MENSKSLKNSRPLKIFGVILLMILCFISFMSGLLTVKGMDGNQVDNWFETQTSLYRVQADTADVLDDFVKKDEDFQKKDITGTVSYEIEQWKGNEKNTLYHPDKDENKSYISSITYLYYMDNPGSDVIDDGEDVYYGEFGSYSDMKAIAESFDDEEYNCYLVTVSIEKPLLESDSYYTEYHDFEILKPYMKYGLAVLIGTLWIALVVIILEISAAGHVKGEEGIHLSALDRWPFDVATLVLWTGAAICIGGVLDAMDSPMITASLKDIYNMVLPLSCIELGCLFLYFWIITLAVRIKAHTLIRNNLCVKLVKTVAKPVVDFMCTVVHTPKWWLGTIILAFGYGILAEFYAMHDLGILGLIFMILSLSSGISLVYCGRDAKVLLQASEELSKGNLDYRIDEESLSRMKGPFKEMGESFTDISEAMEKAVSEKLKSERMKTELITNVSHDLKTPLTSIINYVDLLKKDHTPEQEKEYIEVLERQGQRLKRLTEDVVEASKASTGNISVNMASIDLKEILDQAMAEYEEKLRAADLHVIQNVMEDHMKVTADGRLLWRVVRNLLSNICKYALPGTRVYIDVVRREHEIVMIFKNTSRDELNISADELKERFVRGDSSRHVEGSGLGLSIVESLMKIMNGKCDLVIDGDLFKAEISLKEAES